MTRQARLPEVDVLAAELAVLRAASVSDGARSPEEIVADVQAWLEAIPVEPTGAGR